MKDGKLGEFLSMLHFCLKFAEEENISDSDINSIIKFVLTYDEKNVELLNYLFAIKFLMCNDYFK